MKAGAREGAGNRMVYCRGPGGVPEPFTNSSFSPWGEGGQGDEGGGRVGKPSYSFQKRSSLNFQPLGVTLALTSLIIPGCPQA